MKLNKFFFLDSEFINKFLDLRNLNNEIKKIF